MGESNGLSGLVPSNMVSEVRDPDLIEQYQRNDARQQMASGAASAGNRVQRPAGADNDASRRESQRRFASLPAPARQHQHQDRETPVY